LQARLLETMMLRFLAMSDEQSRIFDEMQKEEVGCRLLLLCGFSPSSAL
jgi:hypothetical protein